MWDVALVLDLVAAVVESGAPPRTAVLAVARASGPPGSPVAAALASVADGAAPRAGDEAFQLAPLRRCLDLAERSGAPVAALLRDAADEVRRSRRRAAALAAATLGVRVVLPLGLCSLPAFALLGVAPVVLSLVSQLLGP